jgi:C-terminal processing protease CtpA/Prc
MRKRTLSTDSRMTAVFMVGLTMAGYILPASAQEEEWKIPREKILRATANSFVMVHFHLQPTERPYPKEDRSYERQQVLQQILAKQTMDCIGVIISPQGHIIMRQVDVPAESIRAVTVTGPNGREAKARPDRIFLHLPAWQMQLTEPMPATWQPLSFHKTQAITPATRLYCAALVPEEKKYLMVYPILATYSWEQPLPQPLYFVTSRSQSWADVLVVCDEQGRAVGVTTSGKIELGPQATAWRGNEILADQGISFEKRKQIEENIKETFAEYIYTVKISFRPPPKEEEDDSYDMYGMMGRYSRGWPGRTSGDKELTLFGLAFAEDKLLIPYAPPQEVVAGIDTITVTVDNEKKADAQFEGVLRQCEGTVLKVKGSKLPKVLNISEATELPRTVPFWTVWVRELAGKDMVVDNARWMQKDQGFADKWYRRVQDRIRPGSWLFDASGKFAGLYTEERKDYERLKPYLIGDDYDSYDPDMFSLYNWKDRYSRSWDSDSGQKIYDGRNLKNLLEKIPDNYDPHIKHLSKDEQKRRVWLGVEFTRISKEMAKQLKVRKQTQDSRLGLMINRVYPDSPAAKMGLKEGHILIKLQSDEMPWPVELKSRERDEYDEPDWEEMEIPEELETMGYRMPRKRPWPSRSNFLTQMLRTIGKNTKVDLTFLDQGNEVTKSFVIEEAPQDTLSADKFKDEKLGLTVKDLTYEVRAALRLPKDTSAVVLAKVEPGTPAALARLNTYELIRALDGHEVASVKEFEAMIKNAQDEKKKSIRITVEWMGKTRLADLKFEAKGPKGIRGLLPGFSGRESNN